MDRLRISGTRWKAKSYGARPAGWRWLIVILSVQTGIRRAGSALRLRCEERRARTLQGGVDDDSGLKVQMQDTDDRRNAAITRVKACSRRFLCAVDDRTRKIVINSLVGAVVFFGKGGK